MCTATAVKELPETSIWHGAISDEDVALVRRRHAEKVEEWLDFADFVTELNALHEKYGIEKGEEGYFAYRKHLRANYYQKLQTYGPTPDPLDEGCDCIFCRMHSKDEPAESATGKIREMSQPTDQAEERSAEPEACRVRCADQPGENLYREDGPPTGPYQRVTKSTASRLGQVPAELPSDFDQSANHKQPIKKLGPVPACKTETCRVRCADQRTPKKHHVIGPHSGPYMMTEIGSSKRAPPRSEKPRPKKMSGAVF